MKKLIITIGILFCVLFTQAQVVSNRSEKITNATTAFGQNLAVGTKIIDIGTGITYKVISASGVLSTYTITTALADALIEKDGKDEQQITLVGNILILEDGGTVDLSGYLDNTDDQQIITFSITSDILTLTLEDGGTVTVDLSIYNNSGTDNQDLSLGTRTGTQQPIDITDGAGVVIDVADNDNSVTNELQSLGLTGNTISLTLDATTIDISTSTAVAANTGKDTTGIYHNNRAALDLVSGTNTGDQTAAEVNITDAGAYYTGTEVETALQEIGSNMLSIETNYIPLSQKGATDGVAELDANGKVPFAQLPENILVYQGTWSALTNAPTLVDGTGTEGDVYYVNLSGTQDLGSGSIHYYAGDWIAYNGSIWQKLSGTNYVHSVNSKTGIVIIDAGDIDIADAGGYYTSTEVEGALQEIGGSVSTLGLQDVLDNDNIATNQRINLNDGGNSVYIGTSAGLNDDRTDNRNVGIGYYSLYSNTTGERNTATGYRSLYNNTTGNNNIAIGYYSLYSNTTGNYNTATGYSSLFYNTTGNYNTANGYYSLFYNTTGINNTATGYLSLYSNTTGSYNTANGYQSLYSNTTGSYNTAVGMHSLRDNTTGNDNTAVGMYSLRDNTTGIRNTATGVYSLSLNLGSYNTATGYTSLYLNTTGNNNTATGYGALYYNTTGSYNIAFGNRSLLNNTGSSNTASGYNSGRYTSTGAANDSTNNSTYLGYDTRSSTNQATNETAIGYTAVGAGDNTIQLGNTAITKVQTSGVVSHADGILDNESATIGQLNTAIGDVETTLDFQTITENGNSTTTTVAGADAVLSGEFTTLSQLNNAINGFAKSAFEDFSESATATTGDVHTIANTPIAGSVEVEYNGVPLPTSAYTVSSNTVQVSQYVYKYDKLRIRYKY